MNPSGVRNLIRDEGAIRNVGFSTSRQEVEAQDGSLTKPGKIHIRKKSDGLVGAAIHQPNTAPAVYEQRDNSESVGIAQMIMGECSTDAVINLRERPFKQEQVGSSSFEESKKRLAF